MWAQCLNAMLGIWLMAAPTILGYGGPARTNHQIVGPLAVSCAVIALWEVTRPRALGQFRARLMAPGRAMDVRSDVGGHSQQQHHRVAPHRLQLRAGQDRPPAFRRRVVRLVEDWPNIMTTPRRWT
jgi:hypothetical protein